MKKLAKLFIALRVVWWVSLMQTQPQYQIGKKKDRKKMKTKIMKKKSLRIVWPDLF
jgi:hypothetical protein